MTFLASHKSKQYYKIIVQHNSIKYCKEIVHLLDRDIYLLQN